MNYILKNGTVYVNGKFVKKDLAIAEGKVLFSFDMNSRPFSVIDCSNKYILPGFIDAHVHLREPGFSYKETIKSGTIITHNERVYFVFMYVGFLLFPVFFRNN